MKLIKELSIKLYNWILSFSKSRFSFLALFIFALSEAIFFPIPPDLLLITLILTIKNLIGISGQMIFKLIILCYFLINFSYFGIKFLY